MDALAPRDDTRSTPGAVPSVHADFRGVIGPTPPDATPDDTDPGTHLPGRGSPTWNSWHAMRPRCTNPNHERWKNYGAKGVRVDPRWDSFAAFVEDLGPRPPGTTLGRFGDQGNYEPGNVAWMTRAEQEANRRGTATT